jgi:hypothetical protein
MEASEVKAAGACVSAKSRNKAALLASSALVLACVAVAPSTAQALPTCSGMAALLLTNPDIAAATSTLVAAAGSNLAYCNVQITYSHLAGPLAGYISGQSQTVKIGVGLPISTADGGSGGVQGAWNGRIEDLGGGGYAGSVGSTTGATNLGNVGSSTDTGHTGGSGTFVLNPDNSFSWGLYNDFSYNGVHAQAVWSKTIAQMYYGQPQNYAYWMGCSEGGHQAMMEAQRFPYDHDGVIAGHPVMYFDRLQPMQIWGEVVSNVELGLEVPSAKLTAVSAAAIASCQNNFGGTPDGIIQDTRACFYNANAYVCGASTAAIGGVPDTTNCLTPQQAQVVNKIWAGVTNSAAVGGGGILYPGWDRGNPLASQNGALSSGIGNPGSINLSYVVDWVLNNVNYNWLDFTEETFQNMIVASEMKFHQTNGVDNPDLSRFRAHGGKMIHYHGLADQLVTSSTSYNYFQRVQALDGSLATTQSYYRFFPIPGNDHCGGTSLAPSQSNAPIENTTDFLTAMEGWVENNNPPATIIGYNNMTHASATISRPFCMYPNTLTYSGSGSIFSASNFTCTTQTSDPLAYINVMANDVGPVLTYGVTPTHDLDNNRSSDIVFRDSSGNIGVWLMSEATAYGAPSTILQSKVLGTVGTNWSIVAQQDLVGQGNTSILWRDAAGDAAIWGMTGTNVSGVSTLSPVQTNWSVVATGAFANATVTKNHTGDILWQDNLGNLAISVTSNGQITSTSPVGQLPANWTVVAADNNGWIFLRNTVTNEVGVWVMNGATVSYAIDFGAVPSNWSVAGIGDFDGDGYSDLLLRDNSGNVGVWVLRTTAAAPYLKIGSTAVLGNVPLTWTIAQTGDYNGDGFSDILWTDKAGDIGAWFMNGTSIASTTMFGNIGTNWTVQSMNSE